AKRLQRAPDAVPEVHGEQYHDGRVPKRVRRVLEFLEEQAPKVAYLFSVQVRDIPLADPGAVLERGQMDDEEDEEHDPGYDHAARSDRLAARAAGRFVRRVVDRPRRTLPEVDADTKYDVHHDEHEQANLDRVQEHAKRNQLVRI